MSFKKEDDIAVFNIIRICQAFTIKQFLECSLSKFKFGLCSQRTENLNESGCRLDKSPDALKGPQSHNRCFESRNLQKAIGSRQQPPGLILLIYQIIIKGGFGNTETLPKIGQNKFPLSLACQFWP